jgi:histidine triad (HIT) family protein
MADCIFCKIAAHEIPSNIVWENERFAAFMDIKPINPGHILIIPKDHVEVVFDMQNERYEEAFVIAKNLSTPLARTTGAVRIAIVVEGLEVPHAHIKLVPLHQAGDLNPGRAKEADPKDLAEMAEKIKKEIANHK